MFAFRFLLGQCIYEVICSSKSYLGPERTWWDKWGFTVISLVILALSVVIKFMIQYPAVHQDIDTFNSKNTSVATRCDSWRLVRGGNYGESGCWQTGDTSEVNLWKRKQTNSATSELPRNESWFHIRSHRNPHESTSLVHSIRTWHGCGKSKSEETEFDPNGIFFFLFFCAALSVFRHPSATVIPHCLITLCMHDSSVHISHPQYPTITSVTIITWRLSPNV